MTFIKAYKVNQMYKVYATEHSHEQNQIRNQALHTYLHACLQ